MKGVLAISLMLLLSQCGGHRVTSEPTPEQSKSLPAAKQCDFSADPPLVVRDTVRSPSVSMSQPDYPPEVKGRKLGDSVVVKVLINVKTGSVEKACAIKGNEMFVQAAERAALQIKVSAYNDYITTRYQYVESQVVYTFVPQ